MNIEIVRTLDFVELEEKLRNIPLMRQDENGNDIFPYKNAHIRLEDFHAEDVNPPTFYLLRKSLQYQKSLHEALRALGHNSLHLTPQSAALEILCKERNELWTLTPPIIELTERIVRYVPQDGEIDYEDKPTNIIIQLICDGAHRVAFSREQGGGFTGVKISGSDSRYPYYAHPNGWDKVKVVDEVPATKEDKKFYRFEDCYGLFRNFDVIGCGKPRGFGK